MAFIIGAEATDKQYELLLKALDKSELLKMEPEELLRYYEILFFVSLSALYAETGPANTKEMFESALASIEKEIPTSKEMH